MSILGSNDQILGGATTNILSEHHSLILSKVLRKEFEMRGQRWEQCIPHLSFHCLGKIVLNSVKEYSTLQNNQSPYPEERFYFVHFSEDVPLPPATNSDTVFSPKIHKTRYSLFNSRITWNDNSYTDH